MPCDSVTARKTVLKEPSILRPRSIAPRSLDTTGCETHDQESAREAATDHAVRVRLSLSRSLLLSAATALYTNPGDGSDEGQWKVDGGTVPSVSVQDGVLA